MKIGDKVSVIDEDLSGTITSVHGNTVIFADAHGFTHTYPSEKLVQKNEALYEDIRIEKKFEYQKKISRKHNRNHLVIDLHFEKLVENPSGYESFERLFIQKEKLLEIIEFCRKNNLKKLEIIHGLGNGTLQKMVHDVLESQTGLDFHNKEILHHQSGSVMVNFV